MVNNTFYIKFFHKLSIIDQNSAFLTSYWEILDILLALSKLFLLF